jgi:hypothetical protein
MTTLLLTTSFALAGCGGSSHHSTRASSPVGGPSGRSHAQRVSRHGASPPGSPAPAARTGPPPVRAARTGPPPARAATRTFLKGWLLYEYGHAKAAVIKDATPIFTTVLADYPPDIPPTPTSRHLYGHLVSLALVRRGSNWLGRAHITDGQGDTFDETVQLIHTGRRWLVDLIIPQP